MVTENTALALVPKTIAISAPNMPTMAEIEAMNAMCKIAAYSGFLSSTAPISNTTQRAADAFFVMMYGRELGIPAMTALKTIYVIDGKPSCSGQALLSLMRKGGMEVEIPDPGTVTTSATVKVKRPGGSWKTFTYTQAMAEAAGLWTRPTWKKHTAEMLIWRAVSTAARFEGSDIVGALYTTEELQPDRAYNEQGDPLDMPLVTVSAPEPEAPATNPDNGEPEGEAVPTEAAKSGVGADDAESGDLDQQADGQDTSAAAVDAPANEDYAIPADLFQTLMKEPSIQQAAKAYQERGATIRKMWAEGAIKQGMDAADIVLAVIDRLQSHRKEGAK